MGCRSCLFPPKFFCCKLNVAAVIIGCLGTLYRLTVLIIFSILLYHTAEYDPVLFELIFSVIVAISAVNLVANLFLLYGVYVRKSLLLLPFLAFQVIEILILLVILGLYSFRTYYIHPSMLYWFVPLAFFIVVLNIYTWMCMANLYVIYAEQQYELDRSNDRIEVYSI